MKPVNECQDGAQGALVGEGASTPRFEEEGEIDQFTSQQPHAHSAAIHPFEIVDSPRTLCLSPSALDAAESSKLSNNFHRWPSFALDAASHDAFARTSFLFADQLQPEDNANNSRRVPINILKLPWQHPFRHHESNRNPYKIPRALFVCLLLTTILALLSAWDAQNHCISNETDALLALLGQASEGGANPNGEEGEEQDELSEGAVQQVITTCREMFRQVMLPVGLVTCLGSLLGLGILRQHQKSFGKKKKPLMVQSPPCFYYFYLPLLFVSGLILAAWTVGIILVMLESRNNDTDNPYTSLAAVDSMGRVADNANLYYMSWFSEGLAILIFYQLLGAFIRQHCPPMITQPPPTMSTTLPANPSIVSNASSAFFPWQHRHSLAPSIIAAKSSMDNSLVQFPALHAPSATFPATTRRYHSSRIKWFQTFYQLRVRTGIWVAALLSSLVVVASSAHIFHEVLLPAAQSLYDDDDYLSYEHRNDWWNVIADNKSHRKVCGILADQSSKLSEEMCSRTVFSLVSGVFAVILCSTAIILHLLTRRSAAADALYYEACGGVYHDLALQMMATKHHHLPLRSELLLSFVLSLWLGWNALMVSSVQGPAPRVGNLYYASWLCFLLSLRICLGCVEEHFNINDEEDHEQQTNSHHTLFSNPDNGKKARASYRAPDLSPDNDSTKTQQARRTPGDEPSVICNDKSTKDAAERERAKRVRRYFFLGTFSAVCAGSAMDAAMNQDYVLTLSEKYMIFAPFTVAVLSAALFMFCLSKSSYATVSQVWCGGVLSCLTFGIWLLNLILTMHSEDSWAVNRVGEIEMANLYYFSWASIITAGLQMTSYAKDALKLEPEDFMLVVWAAIGKVCFVILGAAGHIWHTISDQCDIIEIQNSAITFCSRTILAMIVAGTGLVIGGSVVCIRVLVPTSCFSTRSRAHCEAILSIFLVLLFGVAAAMITGIGGPGQSVGDLYYATWLAFWVSIGIFVSCYDQIKLEDSQSEECNTENAPPNDGVLA